MPRRQEAGKEEDEGFEMLFESTLRGDVRIYRCLRSSSHHVLGGIRHGLRHRRQERAHRKGYSGNKKWTNRVETLERDDRKPGYGFHLLAPAHVIAQRCPNGFFVQIQKLSLPYC